MHMIHLACGEPRKTVTDKAILKSQAIVWHCGLIVEELLSFNILCLCMCAFKWNLNLGLIIWSSFMELSPWLLWLGDLEPQQEFILGFVSFQQFCWCPHSRFIQAQVLIVLTIDCTPVASIQYLITAHRLSLKVERKHFHVHCWNYFPTVKI